ncbi:MAG TPA: hypothetical protein PK502_03830 [Tenuifilaceae bacterium]|nr:hypothetical protein [Tenuifilaceae bacterium]
MGVKQLCSVWLILLANIMLQVHAFVPHHHHNGQVCFDGYSVNITIPNDGNDASNNRAHPTDEDAECCALKHDYLIPDDGFEYKPAVTNIHHGFNIAGGFITSCASIPFQIFLVNTRLYGGYTNNFHFSSYVSIPGLRSPPAKNLL